MSLIPGLPDALVLTHVLARLPYHVRPLLASLSQPWRSALRQPSPPSSRHLLYPLGGLVLDNRLCPPDHRHSLSFLDLRLKTFHPLPPLPPIPSPDQCDEFVCVDGRLFFLPWSGPLFMLDIGAGSWKWEERTRFKPVWCVVAAEGKIYGMLYELGIAVYDVRRDVWEELPDARDHDSQGYGPILTRSNRVIACLSSTVGDSATTFKAYNETEKRWVEDQTLQHLPGDSRSYAFVRHTLWYLRGTRIGYQDENGTWKEIEMQFSPEISQNDKISGGPLVQGETDSVFYSTIRDCLWRGEFDRIKNCVAWTKMPLPPRQPKPLRISIHLLN